MQDTTSILTKVPIPTPQGIVDNLFAALLWVLIVGGVALVYRKWLRSRHESWRERRQAQRVANELRKSAAFVNGVIAGRNRPEVLAWYQNEANEYRSQALGFLIFGVTLFFTLAIGDFRVRWASYLLQFVEYFAFGFMIMNHSLAKYMNNLIAAAARAEVDEEKGEVRYDGMTYTSPPPV